MPAITFIGNWYTGLQDNIPRGILAIKPKDIYRKNIGTVLKKLNELQQKNGELRDLKIKIEFHYRKRTLDQNSLYWALLTIQSNEMNGGMQGKKSDMTTPEQLHEAYLLEYGEREIIKTARKNLSYYRQKKRIEFIIIDNQKIPLHSFLGSEKDNLLEQYITLQVIRGTSEYTTKEMASRIDMVFNEICAGGVNVTQPGDIHNYWVEWRQHLNDEKIILHEEKMTQQQYKEKNPICEGCGTKPGEQLAHIAAKGMGGKVEPEKEDPSNWLHLCSDCHTGIIHQKGWSEFLKIHPHLKYKVNSALKEDTEIPSVANVEGSQGDLFDNIDTQVVKTENMTICNECGEEYCGDICAKCKGIGIF